MKRKNLAVSETVGTLLLLSISVSLFSVIYFSVMTTSPSPIKPPINLICKIEKAINVSTLNIITIEHRGGKPLDLDAEVIVTFNRTTERFLINDYINNESKKNGVFNIGEQVVYPAGDTTNQNVTISVVDKHSNSLIMLVEIQG